VTDDDDDGNTAERASKGITKKRATPYPRSEPRPPVAPPEPNTEDVPLPEPEPANPTKAAPPVLRAFHATWGELFPSDQPREDRLAILAAIIGRDVASSADMTRDDVFRALGFLERMKTGMAGVVRRDGRWVAVPFDPPDEG
jgi:hypothetical protein